MAQKNSSYTMSDRALEMVMIDVLDGMLEFSLESDILSGSHVLSKLSLVNISEEHRQAAGKIAGNTEQEKAAIIHLSQFKK